MAQPSGLRLLRRWQPRRKALPELGIEGKRSGAAVFRGTRMPVADAIENYYAYLDLEGKSDEEAVNAVLASFGTIPSPEALSAVLAYEAAQEHPLQP